MISAFRWALDPVADTSSDPARGVVGLPAMAWAPTATPGARMALLVHGVACTWRFMQALGADLERIAGPDGGRAYDAITYVNHDWRRPIDETARALSSLLERLAAPGVTIDIHGYSQGGLVAGRALALADPAAATRVALLACYDTPLGGSPLAALAGGRALGLARAILPRLGAWASEGVREMAPGTALLAAVSSAPRPGPTRVLVAGDAGTAFAGGLTQRLFAGAPNDGVATVESQLHGARGAATVVVGWDHFGLGQGLPANARAAVVAAVLGSPPGGPTGP